MAGGLQNRTPRSVREAQAFRAVRIGSVAAVAFLVTQILEIAGILGEGLPIVLLLATIMCVLRFAQLTGLRRR